MTNTNTASGKAIRLPHAEAKLTELMGRPATLAERQAYGDLRINAGSYARARSALALRQAQAEADPRPSTWQAYAAAQAEVRRTADNYRRNTRRLASARRKAKRRDPAGIAERVAARYLTAAEAREAEAEAERRAAWPADLAARFAAAKRRQAADSARLSAAVAAAREGDGQ